MARGDVDHVTLGWSELWAINCLQTLTSKVGREIKCKKRHCYDILCQILTSVKLTAAITIVRILPAVSAADATADIRWSTTLSASAKVSVVDDRWLW